LDAAELDECMKDLDQNKDGKISYDEFAVWWLSGRQGLSGWMRKLLSFKLKALKFADTISGTLRDVVAEASAAAVELTTNQLQININKVEEAGHSVYVKLMIASNEAKEAFLAAKTAHNFGDIPEDHSIGQISFAVQGGTADEVIAKIDTALDGPFF